MIEIRACDDWVAIYKDGKKVHENHSCSIVEGLAVLGIPYEYLYNEIDPWDNDLGYFFPEEIPA